MIHPNTELRLINNEIGYGVIATEFIPKGTITWALDKLDREFAPDQMMDFGEGYQQILSKYCFRNNAGRFVLCWDNGRYVNHSFRSNCLSTAYDVELAIRDIHPGEELTDDYGYLNISEPFRANDERTRRKHVYPDDLRRYHRVWDKKLASAFKHLTRVEQPLREVIKPETWAALERVATGAEPMASILALYYDPSSEACNGGSNGSLAAEETACSTSPTV